MTLLLVAFLAVARADTDTDTDVDSGDGGTRSASQLSGETGGCDNAGLAAWGLAGVLIAALVARRR